MKRTTKDRPVAGLGSGVAKAPILDSRPAEHSAVVASPCPAGEALAASELRYRRLFETAKDGILILDAESGMVVDVNPFLVELLGFSRDAFIGKKVWELGFLKDIVANQDHFAELQQQKYIRYEDKPLKTADGRRVDVEFVSNVYLVNRENVIQCNIRDITKRKQTETALRESEERYRLLFDASSDGLLIADSGTQMLSHANPALCRMLGYTAAELTTMRVADLHPKDTFPSITTGFEATGRGERPGIASLPCRRKDGTIVYAEINSTRFFLAGHTNILAVFRDITERQRAEDERNQTLRWQQGINLIQQSLLAPAPLEDKLRNVTDGIVRIFGADFCRIWLIRPGDLCERGCVHAGVKDGPHVCRCHDRCLHLSASSGRYTHLDGQGHRRVPFGAYKIGRLAAGAEHKFITNEVQNDPRVHNHEWARELGLVSFAGYQLRIPGGETLGVLALFAKHPIRPAEDALLDGLSSALAHVVQHAKTEESVIRLAMAVEQVAETIMITDANATILYTNPAFEKNSGYTRDEAVGQTPNFLRSNRQDADFYQRMWAVLGRGEVWRGHLVSKRKDGTIYEEDASISPVRDAAGKVVNYVAAKRDVTHEVQLENQLRQAQKMEAVGRLAGGVAHDFNNLLTGIMGYAELCRDEIAPDHPIREWLNEITREAERSAEITRQLLAFARKQIIMPQVLDLNDAVAGMLKMLRRLIGEDINLAWLPGAKLRPVRIDPSQIDQILANLCINARDAIAGVGKITLETGNLTFDAAACARHADAIPGAYVFLAVSDTGAGMSPETLAQIFEPFFTTKATGKGTGLGLATVYGIVKQNHGFIYAYSEPGQGATFKIYLPQVADELAATTVSDATKAPTGQGETLLLVEDEKSLRLICHRFLENIGYNLLVAGTPEEALKWVDQHPGDIQLLVTDVVMPGMNGQQLAKLIRARKPGVKVLFMSGYTADVMTERGMLDPHTAFLAKPFTRDDLARKVREVLEAREVAPPLTA
ncbi:MAG: PAS domain S-box protein [Lentisphaeria bacterium]